MKTWIIFVIFSVLTNCICHGQTISPEVISSGAGEYENSYASISITIGEPITETISNDTNTLTQGFQQGAIEILFVEEIAKADVAVNIFPNPAENYININIECEGKESFSYDFCDQNGRVIEQSNIDDTKRRIINLNGIAQGQYYVRVQNIDIGYSKTFKIIKTGK